MATTDDGWLDKLDIPAMPDFADDNFNPYYYDGADEWFKGRREPELTAKLQAIVLVQEDEKPVVTELVTVQVDAPVSDCLTEDSSVDDHSSVGICIDVQRNPTPVKTQRAATSVMPANQPPPQRRALPFRAAGKFAVPNQPACKSSKAVSSINGHRSPRPKPSSPLVRVNKSNIPTMSKVAHGSPLPAGHATRRFVAPLRHDELDNGKGPKRRSVAAARAGEYFIHTLREYPEDGKSTPAWK